MPIRSLAALFALLLLAPVARAQEVRTYPTGEEPAETLIAHFVGPDALLVQHSTPGTQLELRGHGTSLRLGPTTHHAFQAAPEGIAGYVVAIDDRIYAVDRDVTKTGPAYRVAKGAKPLAVGTQGSTAVVAYALPHRRYRVVKIHVRPDLSIRRYTTSTHRLQGTLVGILPDGRAVFDTPNGVLLQAADGTVKRYPLPFSNQHRYVVTADAVYVARPLEQTARYSVIALRWNGHLARKRTVTLQFGLAQRLITQVSPGAGNGFHAFVASDAANYYEATLDPDGANARLTRIPIATKPASPLVEVLAGPGDALVLDGTQPAHNELFASRTVLDPGLGNVRVTAPLPGGATLVATSSRTWQLAPDGALTARPPLPAIPHAIDTAPDGSGWMLTATSGQLFHLAADGLAGPPLHVTMQPLAPDDVESGYDVVALADGSALVARTENTPGDKYGAGFPYRTCFVHVAVDGSQSLGDCVQNAGRVIGRAGGAAVLALGGAALTGIDASGHQAWTAQLPMAPASLAIPAATALPDGSFAFVRNTYDAANHGVLTFFHYAADGTPISSRPVTLGPGSFEYLTPTGLYNVNGTTVTQVLTGADLAG